MDIGKLFNGIAVIVDNEIENKTSAIYKIKELIEAKNIPVAVYSQIPQLDVIPALSGASFIILDWDYTNGEAEVGEDERVVIPDALTTSNEERLIAFIKKILSEIFVPVFISFGNNSKTSSKVNAGIQCCILNGSLKVFHSRKLNWGCLSSS